MPLIGSQNSVSLSLIIVYSDSATSYMATLLRDGGDLDSMDRSLLDCELSNERYFKMSHNGSRADIVSLDPTRLSLSCDGSLSKHNITSPSPSSKAVSMTTKLVRIVSPNACNSRCINDSEKIPVCPEKKKKTETIVKFRADSNTMVLASSESVNYTPSEESLSAGREGEICVVE